MPPTGREQVGPPNRNASSWRRLGGRRGGIPPGHEARGLRVPHRRGRHGADRGPRHRDRHALCARHCPSGRSGVGPVVRGPGGFQFDGAEGTGHRPPRPGPVPGRARLRPRQHPPSHRSPRRVQSQPSKGHEARRARQEPLRRGALVPAGLRQRRRSPRRGPGRRRGAGSGEQAGDVNFISPSATVPSPIQLLG